MCVFERWEQQTNSVMKINNKKQGGGQQFFKKVLTSFKKFQDHRFLGF